MDCYLTVVKDGQFGEDELVTSCNNHGFSLTSWSKLVDSSTAANLLWEHVVKESFSNLLPVTSRIALADMFHSFANPLPSKNWFPYDFVDVWHEERNKKRIGTLGEKQTYKHMKWALWQVKQGSEW